MNARPLLLVVLAACTGSIDEVTPGEVYLGRTLDFAIKGDGFSDHSTVDLGAGITINSVHAASATELAVNATVATAAPLGPHDVYIDGAQLADAFVVSPPATAEITGTARRGALVHARLEIVEPSRAWADVKMFASPGITVRTNTVTDTAIDALVAIDASSPLGDATLEVRTVNNVFTIPAALSITDNVDAPILHDELHVQADAAGAAFAWLDPESPLALVDVTTRDAEVIVLDDHGAYPRPIAFSRTQTDVIDGVRGIGFHTANRGAFDVTATRWPLRAVTATSDNRDFASATRLDAPGAYVANATLDEPRYFAVDVDPGSTGQRLRVVTLGDRETDTRISVYSDDRASLLGGPSSDDGALDELVTPTIPSGGRYYIRVEPGAAFDPSHPTFSLAVVTR